MKLVWVVVLVALAGCVSTENFAPLVDKLEQCEQEARETGEWSQCSELEEQLLVQSSQQDLLEYVLNYCEDVSGGAYTLLPTTGRVPMRLRNVTFSHRNPACNACRKKILQGEGPC
jgi:hypothetical protein